MIAMMKVDSVQTGGVAGDLRAAGNVDLTIAAHIDGAASGIVVALGRCIAGDGAAGHLDGAAGGGEERTTILGRVVLDDAAVHIGSAAGGVRYVSIEFPENTAALTVTENKSTAVFDLDFSGTVAGKGLAVQAQI